MSIEDSAAEIRQKLVRAMADKARVIIKLRPDQVEGAAVRSIEATPIELVVPADGRERVVFMGASGTQMLVLLARITDVARADR